MSVAEKVKEKKSQIIQPKKMGLLVENPVYKPFRYPWCYDAWLTLNKEYTGYQKKFHWGMMLEIGRKIYLNQKKIY